MQGQDAVRQKAAEWYFRRDAGPLSREEEAAFRRWLVIPAHRAAYDEIEATWLSLGSIPQPVSATRPQAPAPRPGRRAAAAMLAAMLALGVLGYWGAGMRDPGLATAIGETREITLADGSRVSLNTDSAVAVDYDAGERRVRLLRGEALFTVAKDAARPFTVEAAGGRARALGTAFIVRREAEGASVAVAESRVAVTYPAGTDRSVTVSPGEAVSFAQGRLGPVEPVDIAERTAWRRGKLVFVDRPLGQVIDELNRYHRGHIRIVDPAIRSHSVSGVFATGDPLAVVDALETSLGLRSTRLTRYLVLLHR